MRNGGQSPWNALPLCETFRISCLMGRLHVGDALENFSKDQSSRLVHWLSITLSLRKTSQESFSLEESLTWIVPWIRSVRGWNLEG